MAVLSSLVRASGTITAGVIANAETITVGGKVYTFQTTLTDVNGNVKLGTDDDETIDNLVAAINLGAGAGTAYAASMTVNPHVTAVADGESPNVCTVTAKVPGLIGNLIALAEATTGATLSGAVLTSGAGSISTAISEIRAQCQVNSEVLEALDRIDASASAEV
jgi:hypothetical protein